MEKKENPKRYRRLDKADRVAIENGLDKLLDALGVEKVPYGELDMTVGAVEADRRLRGREPLVP